MIRSACAGVLAATLLLAVSPAAEGSGLPPPSFRPTPGWLTVTTGPQPWRGWAPQVWAIPERSNLAALAPFALFNSLRLLSPNGIVLWATTSGRGGPTRTFVPDRLPLRLASFRVDETWEGQPGRNVQQRLRWVAVAGWRLDVRVYFGTQHPRHGLVAAAQRELARLRLPAGPR